MVIISILIKGIGRCQEAILTAVNELDDKHLFKIKEHISILKGDKLPIRRNHQSESRILTKNGSTSSLSPESIEKNLLEELYPDRLFLKECMADSVLMDNDDVAELIRQGNMFLDQRIEYYKARNPFAVKLN